MERAAVPGHERLARAYVAHRFPSLASAPLVGHRACQYEITADSNFLIAPHPDHDGRVWLMGGGSGHGFKHGPALAERMERWLTGAEPPEPHLALGTRAADAALRTAGARAE
jgi:glycine/D-amino acid oxidase-like deaminating enzyme